MADETPVTPEVPETPAATPETPATSATPETPATPATPETPATPATPAAPETPATPEMPPAKWYQSDAVPDDWREQVAGEDEAKLNMLKRIPDFGTFLNNYFEAQNTLRSKQDAAAQNPAVPGEDASDADWAAYREATGVPAEPAGYAEHLSDGLQLGEEDQKALQPFFDVFHAENIPGEKAAKLVDAYYELDSQEKQRVAHEDSVASVQAREMLKQAWGGDFEQNKNLVETMFRGSLPAEAVDAFMGGRLADGTAIFNHPGILQAFAGMARELNPTATLVPSGENPMQTLDARKSELETIMRDDSQRWYKDSKLQQEYQEIITAQEQLRSRQGSRG